MQMLHDYQCKLHGEYEEWGSAGESSPCPRCGARCMPLPRFGGFSLPGHDLGFPTAADKWARRHERHEEPGREI